jgi:bacterioferritin
MKHAESIQERLWYLEGVPTTQLAPIDVTTAFVFKEILEDEEEHHDLFTTMLEEV